MFCSQSLTASDNSSLSLLFSFESCSMVRFRVYLSSLCYSCSCSNYSWSWSNADYLFLRLTNATSYFLRRMLIYINLFSYSASRDSFSSYLRSRRLLSSTYTILRVSSATLRSVSKLFILSSAFVSFFLVF
jgi:hypothetical protein